MNFKTRYDGFSNVQPSQTVKNWVIGWTPAEAKAAAQQKSIVKQSTVKPGMFGVPVFTNNH
jgi:hypothetical protein